MKNKLMNNKGQAMVEFAFTFGLYMALLFMAADFGFVGYQWTVLQYAANQGARIGRFGYIQDVDPETGDDFKSTGLTSAVITEIADKTDEIKPNTDARRVDTIKSIVIVVAKQYGVELTKDDVLVYDKDHTQITDGQSADTTSDDMMYVQAKKAVGIPGLSNTIQNLLGFAGSNFSFNLTGEALSKNEPFRTQP